MENENKTEKGKTKGLHRGILQTRVLHKNFYVQSLWKIFNYMYKGKTKRCLHKNAEK